MWYTFHDHKIMIECNGIQHYNETSFSGYGDEEENFKYIQECDKIIRIRYDEKDIEGLLINKLAEIIK